MEYILDEKVEEILQRESALEASISRIRLKSEKDQEIGDWLDGRHMLGKDIDTVIVNFLSNNTEELIISGNVLKYLESVSLEEYKSILAYFNWINKGSIIHSEKDIISQDWREADIFINGYMDLFSSIHCHDSVIDYLKSCKDISDKITNRKAYLLFLAHPDQDSWINFQTAKNFVDTLYNPDIIMPAINGDPGCRAQIKDLVLANQEIANMFEFNIFRIKEIRTPSKDEQIAKNVPF